MLANLFKSNATNLLLVVAVCLIVHIIPSQIDIFVAAIMDIQASLEVLELWW